MPLTTGPTARADTSVSRPAMWLLVVDLSDSFSDYWGPLADALGVELRRTTPAEASAASTGATAVVLAAGGVERDLPQSIPALALPNGTPVFAIGAVTSHRTAARAVAAGAADYFALPGDRDALHAALEAAVARRRSALDRAALAHLEAQSHAFREIIGESPALKQALNRAARVLPHADATVLITGETGTGKELLARAVHYGGPRAAAPFVELNCAALPPQLLESEIFGHERGAFTDAKSAKPGLLEVAHGGTLFLDEVDRLTAELQGKLLRAIELKAARRLGATATRTFDVRIVAATNADLGVAVREGRFREDLYYRLRVVTLSLPPLRERGEDVIRLADFFLAKFSTQYSLPHPAITKDVRAALTAQPWPGNVRELRNTVERVILLSPPGTLDLAELNGPGTIRPARSGAIPFPARLADIQRAAARAMLQESGGNHSEAARRLGISRSRLSRLLKGGPDVGDDPDPD
ncbi:MAG TPA: sigma 54-interacting transcriptional regulator [Gemmatimonadales bacterium]|nr:sigma 54-interacting transcriptional regulator [Gemmatimonadales bacterium]